jgi:uncharacterized membrane protein YfcA
LFLFGGAIGLFSGWMGIGGGVFLTPLLLLAGFADMTMAALISATFIFVNSAVGLTGWLQTGKGMPQMFWWLAPVVLLGGWLGARWGASRASSAVLRRCLSGMLLLAIVKIIWLS